jgi:predicted enzyme related to lactoylglutathione lyase
LTNSNINVIFERSYILEAKKRMKVIHFEIPAKNPQSLIKFYTNIFGWNFSQWKDVGFWVALTGSPSEFGIDGGIIDINEIDMPLTNVIEVDNIDKVLEKIVEKGGVITIPKFLVEGAGYLAYFKDLDNNLFGLRQIDPNL